MSNYPADPEEGGALVAYEDSTHHLEDDQPIRRGAASGRLVRVLLPIAALLLVGGVFFLANRSIVKTPKGLSIDGIVIGDGLEVTNPRFVGETDDGAPFLLTAKRAKPDGPDPENIRLDTVTGDVGLSAGRKLKASAEDGLFQPKKNALSLSGEVVVKTTDGYQLSSEKMRFDIATRTGRTETPVRIEGPMGELTADKMEAQFDKDLVANFSGRVKITIRRLVERDE